MLCFVSEDVGDDPNPAQVGNPVEFGGVLEMLARTDVPGEYEPVDRRDDVDALRKKPGFGHLLNLHVTHPKIAQAVGVALHAA